MGPAAWLSETPMGRRSREAHVGSGFPPPRLAEDRDLLFAGSAPMPPAGVVAAPAQHASPRPRTRCPRSRREARAYPARFASTLVSHPFGQSSTAGCTFNARASFSARSTPMETRSASMLETVPSGTKPSEPMRWAQVVNAERRSSHAMDFSFGREGLAGENVRPSRLRGRGEPAGATRGRNG